MVGGETEQRGPNVGAEGTIAASVDDSKEHEAPRKSCVASTTRHDHK
jgi:hypothetical protein